MPPLRPLHSIVVGFLLVLSLAVLIGGCRTTEGFGQVDASSRRGQEIVVAGRYFDIGTPVVLWSDPGGLDAYSEVPAFEAAPTGPDGLPIRKRRYGDRGNLPVDVETRVRNEGWTPETLAKVARQFVLHYDVAGTSRQCFKILQDRRNLSVHFLLDVDGTIYQSVDLKERAWHAGAANDRSIGIEIAHIGAYPAPGHPVMRSWYEPDTDGLKVRFPAWLKETGIRTPGFVARPERAELLEGEIHGKRYWQHDYTAEQRRALTHLAAGLHRALGIPLRVPRDAYGEVRTDALSEAEQAGFAGILGHQHVTTNKIDPGPAMDWERLLREAKALVED